MTRPRYMYRVFVSRCILMYRDEESKIHRCILICIQCDIKEAHKIHVLYVSYVYPKCILDSFRIRAGGNLICRCA